MAFLIKKSSAEKEEINFAGVSIGVDLTFRLLFVDREIWFDSEEGDFLYNEVNNLGLLREVRGIGKILEIKKIIFDFLLISKVKRY